MKSQLQTIAKTLPLIAAAVLLSACGSSVQPRDGASASTTPTTLTTPTLGAVVTPSGDVGTQCNYFDSTETRLSGRVTTAWVNNVIQEDKIRLRITSLNDIFDTGSNVYVKFYRWQVSSTGSVNLDTNPVEFIVENSSGAISSRMTSISATDIASLRQSSGMSGTTGIDFFTNTTLILQNVDYNWQALKVVLYQNTSVVGSADLLLPVFTANPNKYQAAHPGVLPALHPMFKDRALNLSDADWGARFNTYCF